ALGPDGRIERLAFTVRDPYDRGLVWPQHLTVALGYPGTVIDLALDVSGRPAVLDGARGLERPLFVLPNGGGLGYGLFLLDEASREYLLAHVEDVPDALTRGSAWVTLWDNL